MPAATTRMRAIACLSFTCLSFGAVSLDHSAMTLQPRPTDPASAGYPTPGQRDAPFRAADSLGCRRATIDKAANSRRTEILGSFQNARDVPGPTLSKLHARSNCCPL